MSFRPHHQENDLENRLEEKVEVTRRDKVDAAYVGGDGNARDLILVTVGYCIYEHHLGFWKQELCPPARLFAVVWPIFFLSDIEEMLVLCHIIQLASILVHQSF